jgi:methyltransferase
MSVVRAVILLVALERLVELVYAARNTRNLRRRGAVEVGQGHYPVIVLLHAAWLAALLVLVPAATRPVWWLLGLFALLQGARLWVLASLGPFWTTRVLTLPGAPVVRRGPYRWVRHPNYLVVIAEIAILPLAFRTWAVSAVFSALNLAIILWRVRIEDRALAPRRA